MNISKRILPALLVLCVLFCTACNKKAQNEIIMEFDTPQAASEHCGMSVVDFVPAGYKPCAYRTVYGFVSETEYEKDGEIAVLRIADAQYNVSNLSGYADTLLYDVYTSRLGGEFEIESREGVFACEWQTDFGGKPCNVSYVLHGGDYDGYKKQLEELLTYLSDKE